MTFTFKHGDRPLTGYTIQRGVGRGGFGEVYYAVSDGGKEVALKYLRDNPQIELRGVEHCMNMKSPHLVTIYDVKQNDAGEYFIVMEYISGPSLRDLLIAEPKGLGAQKAAYFLREMGKGLGYLHDRGIVHRDLKPGNIFYEDGYVKIGDYGLSKFISVSQHSVQTSSVGTVHYMAPEVGSGNYGRGVDIYALGVILYEMLLGRVPYEGASMGEVLMKHLTAQPTVDELPAPFADVIRKSLAKDPKDRYATIDEMVESVMGVEDVRNSVARFEPTSVSMAAARAVPQYAHVGGSSGKAVHTPNGRWGGSSAVGSQENQRPPYRVADRARPDGRPIDSYKEHLSYQLGDLTRKVLGIGKDRLPPSNLMVPMDWSRLITAGLVAAALSGGLAMLVGGINQLDTLFWTVLLLVGAVSCAAWGGAFVSMRGRISRSNTLLQRIIVLGVAILLMFLVDAMIDRSQMSVKLMDRTAGGLVLSCLFVNWTRRVKSGMQGRVELGHAVRAGIAAGMLCLITGGEDMFLTAAGIAATASLVVEAGVFYRMKEDGEAGQAMSADRTVRPIGQDELGRPVRTRNMDDGPGLPVAQAQRNEAWPRPTITTDAASIPTHPLQRSYASIVFWGVVSMLLLASGLICLVWYGSISASSHNDERAISLGFALSCFASMIFTLGKVRKYRRLGWWREWLRPFLMALSLISIAHSTAWLSEGRLSNDETIIAAVFSILPGTFMLFLLAMRGQRYAEERRLLAASSGGNSISDLYYHTAGDTHVIDAPDKVVQRDMLDPVGKEEPASSVAMTPWYEGQGQKAAHGEQTSTPVHPLKRSYAARGLWGLASVLLLSGFGLCLAWFDDATRDRYGHHVRAISVGMALSCWSMLLFTLSKLYKYRRLGMWREWFRPFLISGCMVALATTIAWMTQGMLTCDAFIAVGFLITPALLLLFFLAMQGECVDEEKALLAMTPDGDTARGRFFRSVRFEGGLIAAWLVLILVLSIVLAQGPFANPMQTFDSVMGGGI